MNWLCLLLPQRQVSRRATFYDWGRDSFVIAMKKVDFSSLDVRLAWINIERSDWLSVSTIVYCIEMQTPLWLFEHELWPFDNFHSCRADTQTHFCTCFLLMCVLVIAVIVEIMYILCYWKKEMATYRHWSASLWRDPDDVPHCRILSPDKTEWRIISATLCGWRRCFVADQLWFMTRIREEEDWKLLALSIVFANFFLLVNFCIISCSIVWLYFRNNYTT